MKDTLAKIEYVDQLNPVHFKLGLKVDWEKFTSGQFVMLHPPKQATFLSRPFGIVNLENGVLELCIKIIGSGTQALAQAQVGESLKVIGPLGNGFDIPSNIKQAVLVAGGYGIAPLLPLAKAIKNQGKKVSFYYGAKTVDDLLYTESLADLDLNLNYTTEDGSKGKKGLILDILKPDLKNMGQATIFASGPSGLLQALSKLALDNKIPAQISLDSYMACGIGVCLGCMVKMKDGSLKRACREGPVFNASELCNQI
ncbi:MAG: dihydroorotate dehydrogenase electron transfer subunit [Pseudomonadota bacterium]